MRSTAFIALARACYGRGWVVGTSGNFSAVVSDEPFRLAVTASGLHKGELAPEHVVCVDAEGILVEGAGRPSAETSLHLAIARVRGGRVMAHTHSVWGTLLSQRHAAAGLAPNAPNVGAPAMTSRDVAEAAYRGAAHGKRVVVAGVRNRVAVLASRVLSRRTMTRLVRRLQERRRDAR